MKTRVMEVFVSLALALALMIAMTLPAGAQAKSKLAMVTVSTLVNFTVQDNGSPGLRFGRLYPGSIDNPELAQILIQFQLHESVPVGRST